MSRSSLVFISTLAAFTLAAPARATQVASIVPANNAVGVATNTGVVLTFDVALDPATVTAQTIHVWGRTSGPVPGTLALDAAQKQVTFTPQRAYFPAEWVMVRASSGVKSAGGQALAGGFFATFAVRGGQGTKTFQLAQVIEFRDPGEGLTRLYGFNAVDVDGDGSPDMSGTNEVSNDVRLKRNDGCGGFAPHVKYPLGGGQEPSPNDAGDLDGDGRPDLVTGNQGGNSVSVFKNSGTGGYLPPATIGVSGACHGVAIVDAEGDGDLDVLAANLSTVRLLRNNGSGTLANVAGFDGGPGEWQVAVADANGDGFGDAFVANNFNGSVGLLLGNGAGSFALSASKNIGTAGWAIGAGDVDGDGNADAVCTDNGGQKVAVVRGDGAGGLFPQVSYGVGSLPVSVRLADLDGDADLDLSVANFGSANCHVFTNQGGTFTLLQTFASNQSGSCTVLVDYDRDGDTDVFVTDELTDQAWVYRQVGPSPALVQPPSCAAALRLNEFALRAGFGSVPPQPLGLGQTLFVDLSGAANEPVLLLLGLSAPGAPTAAGLFNLSPAGPLITIVAFSPGGFGTDASGEARLSLPIPLAAPTGVPATLQGAVGSAAPLGATLTNPETIVLVP